MLTPEQKAELRERFSEVQARTQIEQDLFDDIAEALDELDLINNHFLDAKELIQNMMKKEEYKRIKYAEDCIRSELQKLEEALEVTVDHVTIGTRRYNRLDTTILCIK